MFQMSCIQISAHMAARLYTALIALSLWLAAAAALSAVPLRWEKTEGAVAYRVEVADESGRLIFFRDTGALSVEVPLEPGSYRLRISALNKFYQIDTPGEWRAVTVRRRETDKKKRVAFKRFSPRSLDAQNAGVLTIHGKNLPIGFRIHLENAGGKRAELQVRWTDAETVEAALPAKVFLPGTYTVILTTPGGEVFRKSGLSLRDGGISPGPLYAGIDFALQRSNAWWKEKTVLGGVFAGYELPLNFAAELGFTMIGSMRSDWPADKLPVKGAESRVLNVLDATALWAPALFDFPVNPVLAANAGYAFGAGFTFGFSVFLRVDITRSLFADLGYTWRMFPGYRVHARYEGGRSSSFPVEMEGIVLRAAMRL